MLRASGRPQGEKLMVQIRERPAAADRNEARIAVLGENHGCTCPSCICPMHGGPPWLTLCRADCLIATFIFKIPG
jgi:hypothetical protein